MALVVRVYCDKCGDEVQVTSLLPEGTDIKARVRVSCKCLADERLSASEHVFNSIMKAAKEVQDKAGRKG